jgi:hypothetical protein
LPETGKNQWQPRLPLFFVEAMSQAQARLQLATARKRLKMRVSVLKSFVEAIVGAIYDRPERGSRS